MKKSLLTIGILATGLSVQAQTVLLHVDDTAKMYVSNGALVYNGGGVQTRGNGNIDLHGNMMVVGSNATDVFRTIDTNTTPGPKTSGANVILRLNDPSPANFATSTYGQLYITNLTQDKITGIVDKEYKAVNQGSFQQMALPFANKTVQSIANDLGKAANFTGNRSTSSLAYWDNTKTVMRIVNPATSTDPGNSTVLYGPTTYFAVGTSGWNPTPANSAVLTLKGVPYSDAVAATSSVNLLGGGVGIDYGSSGQYTNYFGERYNSYLNDPFDTSWTPNYGKELYQYGNPFLTNIDLSWIGADVGEPGATLDGNRLPIKGIRFSQEGVNYSSSGGTTTSTNRTVTFSRNTSTGATIPAGDVNSLVIKPLGVVYIKLDPTLVTTYAAANLNRLLNFNTTRRFATAARAAGSYSVTAAKNSPSSTLKQLGVIALDSQDNEISRTYYVVRDNATTGYSSVATLQANIGYNSDNTPTNGPIYTNEEYMTGGIDPTYASQYNLYINEANEANFLHKKIPLKLNSPEISKLKFEIREDALLIPANQSALSAGESFWIKINGANVMLSQNQVISAGSVTEAGLYYGEPQPETVLGTSDLTKKSGTIVTYEKSSDNFVVIFDKNWKNANITIFDMSGKLINSEKEVNTKSNHTLNIPKQLNNGYLITIKADNGQVYNTKVMR
ncbi:T9SS type A sorting domain-containing protein [Chryseobacterium sp. LC2016-29]|uniref:T9SS type A sorting domain-containing protein n=1 Tax=Chryseobacterium sp. LC2016-29 TaxID=2897331 RepID=UPI001E61094B|nr:T9SS type A sorting domain-containing protein [Chryseobacterium sp. LC2016-29]MCD0479934.1 T9SS type A sorting domain-containing protein [Chryseobacterium sp. LC2016-29]